MEHASFTVPKRLYLGFAYFNIRNQWLYNHSWALDDVTGHFQKNFNCSGDPAGVWRGRNADKPARRSPEALLIRGISPGESYR